MKDYQPEENKKSKYNAAVSQMFRLDSLWQECQRLRGEGNLKDWNHRLDFIWTELADHADQNHEKRFKVFMKLIVKYNKNVIFLNQILMRKEIFLRQLQNEQGKGTAYQDPYEDDFE